MVTGTTGLALHTGAGAFRWAAAGLYLALVAAWAVVSVRTAAGAWRGSLLRAAPPAIPADEVAELTRTGEGITGRPA
jgi:hypothetical protein